LEVRVLFLSFLEGAAKSPQVTLVGINAHAKKIGNSTFAGATAAIMANVVLVAYIVVAMREDQSEAINAAEKKRH
jgi:hypothetical protein